MEKIKRTPNTILDIGCRGKGEGDKKGTVVSEALMEVVEKPLAKILTEMEKTGALLDVGYLKKLSEEKHKELNGLEKKYGNWPAGISTSIHPSKWARFCL